MTHWYIGIQQIIFDASIIIYRYIQGQIVQLIITFNPDIYTNCNSQSTKFLYIAVVFILFDAVNTERTVVCTHRKKAGNK